METKTETLIETSLRPGDECVWFVHQEVMQFQRGTKPLFDRGNSFSRHVGPLTKTQVAIITDIIGDVCGLKSQCTADRPDLIIFRFE